MLKLNAEIRGKEDELSRMKQKEKYMNIIYVLVAVGIMLLAFLVSKQIKVTKMTQEVHDIQTKLVGRELKKRDLRDKD
jgi:cell division protein FtsL